MRRTLQQKLMMYTRSSFYQKVISDLQDVEERVCLFLQKNEHHRNCDKCLIWDYWKEVDYLTYLPNEHEIHNLTHPESIRRVRQRLQEMGLWPPTDDDVIKKRKIKEQAMRDWAVHKEMIGI